MFNYAILYLCFLLIIPNISSAQNNDGYVAYVNYSELDEILVEYISINPKYSELVKEYTDFRRDKKKKSDEFQKKIEEGTVDFKKMAASMMASEDPPIKDKVETLVHAELIVIIEELYPEKYKLVLNNSYRDDVLYNNTIIPDITSNVRQFLLKKIKNN